MGLGTDVFSADAGQKNIRGLINETGLRSWDQIFRNYGIMLPYPAAGLKSLQWGRYITGKLGVSPGWLHFSPVKTEGYGFWPPPIELPIQLPIQLPIRRPWRCALLGSALIVSISSLGICNRVCHDHDN